MAFAKIFQGFRSTTNLHEPQTNGHGTAATVQLVKTPILIENPVAQRKGSRLFKSLVNPKRRERETILPDLNLLEVKGPKIGLDVVKIFQDVDHKYVQKTSGLSSMTKIIADLLHTSIKRNSSHLTESSAASAPSPLYEKSINGKNQEALLHLTHHV